MYKQPLILVVEQNLNNLELLDSYLKKLNFSCICATKGLRGMILAQTHQPDLIILDMMLCDLNSSQVIDYLKHNTKTATIPIISVIPLASAQNMNCLCLTGADDYITKPYDLSRLEIVINRHLHRVSTSNLHCE
jgi:two-component system cell cycle response regulator DivK